MNYEAHTMKRQSLKDALDRVLAGITEIKSKRCKLDAKMRPVHGHRYATMKLRKLIIDRCALQALIARF